MEPITNPHAYEEHLERDLETLRTKLRSSADLVLASLHDALSALANQDRKLAYSVILRDHRIDLLEISIDQLAQEFLVRHMPVGTLLRFTLALFKVNAEIERAGDYAEAIARRAVSLRAKGGAAFPSKERLLETGRLATSMLADATSAFLRQDSELALATLERESHVNAMSRGLFADLTTVAASERDLSSRFVLLGVLNRIERVADRACNIAEEAIYVAKGEIVRHILRHDVPVLFVCDDNACRSQMAEGIAHSVAPKQLRFSSAGIEPRPLDPGAVRFMAAKGIDISRQRPKGMADVGTLDSYAVIVTLSPRAEEALPPVPYKSIALHWDLPDPTKEGLTPDEKEATYQAVYDELRTKITELAEELAGDRGERQEEA